MSSYEALAGAYDGLMQDGLYRKRADYLLRQFRRSAIPVHSVLDLACGTGTIACMLAEQGYTAAGAAAVISFFSAVLTVGKIGQGILYSKVGVKKGSIPMFFLYVLAFLLLCIPGMAYPAFFCLALGMGTLTTLVPLISKVIFGQREYAAIYSIVSMSMSIGTFVGTPCWGLLYDLTGSYRGGFLVMAALLAAAFLLQNLALKLREKELKNGENL